MNNRLRWSTYLINASMIWYILWLMLPAVQVRLRAVTGGAALAVFAVGVLLDFGTFWKNLKSFVPRVLCIAALPLLLVLFLHRGSDAKLGYLAQQVMFWFPLLWCAYVRQIKGKVAYRAVFTTMLVACAVTILITIGWLIAGVFYTNGTDVNFARALGNARTDPAFAKEIMRHNIGGYDFVYAAMLSLPFLFYLAGGKGWKRPVFILLYILVLVMIALSQYTFAMLFALIITAAELAGLLLRKLFKRLSVGASLLCTIPLFLLLFLLRVPLVAELEKLANSLQLVRIAGNLQQLYNALTGAPAADSVRLITYLPPLNSFLASPFIGGIFTGEAELGLHSEVLDMLAALGVIGTVFFLAAIWLIGRGMGRGIKGSGALPHLVLQWMALAALASVNTVFYSREIPLVICLCMLFIVWTERGKSGIIVENKSRGASN